MTLLGGAVAWPLAAHAQQPHMPMIGYLYAGSAQTVGPLIALFRQGLAEQGYVEGQNVRIEYRWAEGDYTRLMGLAIDLVQRDVSLIVTPPSTAAALAAKAATTTIPIVFGRFADCAQRRGGNRTDLPTASVAETGRKVHADRRPKGGPPET